MTDYPRAPAITNQGEVWSSWAPRVRAGVQWITPFIQQWFIPLILKISIKLSTKLKLPSLFAAWLFWIFHTKTHNMKAMVILSHSWSPFLPLTCLCGKNELLWVYVQPSGVFSWENSSQITHANHMIMITSGQIWSRPDYRKTNIVGLVFVYILLSTCQ